MVGAVLDGRRRATGRVVTRLVGFSFCLWVRLKMGGKIRGLGSTGDDGAWVTAGMCERDKPGFSMVGGCCWVAEKDEKRRKTGKFVGGRTRLGCCKTDCARADKHMPIKSELFSACPLLVTSIAFIFVSLFPYFLVVGSAGQAVTLSPDLLRCAAKPVVLHWLYQSSTVRGLGQVEGVTRMGVACQSSAGDFIGLFIQGAEV